ncbi:hypothetical protein B7494_g320 [Chlorociboria aeruginascens]|nr:hypothetical protein B7494_g320 [Chlorociboria aeruginascens]
MNSNMRNFQGGHGGNQQPLTGSRNVASQSRPTARPRGPRIPLTSAVHEKEVPSAIDQMRETIIAISYISNAKDAEIRALQTSLVEKNSVIDTMMEHIVALRDQNRDLKGYIGEMKARYSRSSSDHHGMDTQLRYLEIANESSNRYSKYGSPKISASAIDVNIEINVTVIKGMDDIHTNCFDKFSQWTHNIISQAYPSYVEESAKTVHMTANALAQHYRTDQGPVRGAEYLLGGSLNNVRLVEDDKWQWMIKTWVTSVIWTTGRQSNICAKSENNYHNELLLGYGVLWETKVDYYL